MKIAIVSPEFPPERGGIQTYSFEFARELGCHGHDVTVFTRAHDGGEMKDTPFHIEPVLQLRRRTDRGILRDQSFDVWHAMNAAYSWLALENPRTFVTVHGTDFLLPYFPVERFDFAQRLGFGARLDCWIGDRLTSALVQRALPRAAHIFTNSRYTEKRFCEKNPSCRGKTSAAMVGVSEEYFALPRPAAGSPSQVFSTGKNFMNTCSTANCSSSRLPRHRSLTKGSASSISKQMPVAARCWPPGSAVPPKRSRIR